MEKARARARASYRPVRHMHNFMAGRSVTWLLQFVHAPHEVVSKLHLHPLPYYIVYYVLGSVRIGWYSTLTLPGKSIYTTCIQHDTTCVQHDVTLVQCDTTCVQHVYNIIQHVHNVHSKHNYC